MNLGVYLASRCDHNLRLYTITKAIQMSYDYRKLTPEEQKEIVHQRSERGYPLHSPPHPFRFAGFYLLTASNYEHHAFMSDPSRRTEFETRLLKTFQDIEAEISGWVVLPNHYHILIGVDDFYLIPSALGELHGRTSFEWNKADDCRGRRVWYRYVDQFIRTEAHYYRALNYIHYNPIKHGYVHDVYEWPWSSLAGYLEYEGRDWLREKWSQHPAKDFGDGWDDEMYS
jgi:putative transposase